MKEILRSRQLNDTAHQLRVNYNELIIIHTNAHTKREIKQDA